MTKPKIFTDEEQIAAIDAAIANGCRILSVDLEITDPKSGKGSFATVRFVQSTERGYETQDWSCGFKAGNYAANLMRESA